MQNPRSRFSRRHLLALCTFLVPLAVLAALGQSELSRRGTQAEAALEREAMTFLRSAVQALDQQIDRQVPLVVEESQRELATRGPLRTALWLREQQGFAAVLDIVTLDEQVALVWPDGPPPSLSLPFSRDARPRGNETRITGALQSADLLLTTGQTRAAADLLQHLVSLLEEANPPNRSGRRDIDPSEPLARFRLATALQALGETEAARKEFEKVRSGIAGGFPGGRYEHEALGVMAEVGIAETGSTADRIVVLQAIAEGKRDLYVADGLLTALATRLHRGIPADDPQHGEATQLLREEQQRARTSAFAGDYNLLFKETLRVRLRQSTLTRADADSPAPAEAQVVRTLANATTLLWVRPATEPERTAQRCAWVGLRFDLGLLLAPALQPFFGGDATFVLAIHDPEDVPMVPAPTAVPTDFSPPSMESHGLTLRAYPANAERQIAETQAAARNRAFLLLALFVTAVGGALWLWRSVSREAELASLKVDLVSRVSHELKTPLALIRMYGETLGMGRARDSDQASHFGGIIARESERLTTLIQRILDFSRQQAGTLQYSPTVVDLGALLRAVCDAYTPHLEARGAILVETLRHGVFARCDANACESAVVNLLENAAKYAIEGDDEHEIELDLQAASGMATIEVRDRGRGVPDGEWERIFDGFYRASNAGEVRGAGLGLSLVRHFARAHGGDATAEQREGGGSVFRLSLPLCAAPGTSPTEDTPTDVAHGTAHGTGHHTDQLPRPDAAAANDRPRTP